MSYQFNEEEVLRRLGMAMDPNRWWRWLPLAVAGLVILVAAVTSVHTVEPEGVSVVKRFGQVTGIREPGLHFKLPFGIDRAYFVPTRMVQKEEFGFRIQEAGQRVKGQAAQDESLMLSGDLNVIDVEWVVQYRIEDADRWLHRVQDPRVTLRDISESVMRQIVGNRLGSEVLTVGRTEIAQLALQRLQEILGDGYEMGVLITNVELQNVTPPDPVKPAFNAVNESRQQRERLINEAERERNQLIPRAQGEAARVVDEAEGEAIRIVNRARGDAARFTALYAAYAESPEVTRRRLYLEMIDQVLPKAGQVLVIEQGQTSPLPLLNLPAVGRAQSSGTQQEVQR